MKTRRRSDQRGFAMLLVFLMAAIVALSLYMEIPRVSFESQRNKEGLLIERGEQYKRALKVFVAANKRYPARIEELESFNNHRYLRKRYVDPMTGKSEWRIIHIGPGGVFTDSLTHKPKDGKDKDQQSTQNFIGDPTLVAGTQLSAVPKRRDSELAGLCNPPAGQGVPGQPGMPGMPGMPGQQPIFPGQPMMPGQPGIPIQPQVNPATGQPMVPAGTVGAPGSTTPCPAGPLPGQPGYTGQTYPGQTYPGQPGYPGQTYPGQPGYPGQTHPGQQPPGMPPYPTQPGSVPTGAGGFQQPGMNPAAPGMAPGTSNSAQQLIQNLLTQPRPGGFPGQQQQQGNQTIGGGIAGFASNADEEGIKVYNDRTNYKEWEFIYDYTKDTGVVGQQGAGNPIGTPIGQQPGQTPQPQPTPFGQTPPGFGPQPNTPPPGYVPPPPPPPPQVQPPQQ